MTLIEYIIALVWLTGFAGYSYFIYVEVIRSEEFRVPKLLSEFVDEFISIWSEVFHALAKAAGFTFKQTKEIPQKVLTAVRSVSGHERIIEQEIIDKVEAIEELTKFVPIDADAALERLHQNIIKSQFELMKDIVDVLAVQPDNLRHLEIGHVTMSIISSVFLKYGLRGREEAANLIQKLVFENLKEGQKRGFNVTRAAVEYDKRKVQYSEQLEKALHKPSSSIEDFNTMSKVFLRHLLKDEVRDGLKTVERNVSSLLFRHFELHKEYVRNELVVPRVDE